MHVLDTFGIWLWPDVASSIMAAVAAVIYTYAWTQGLPARKRFKPSALLALGMVATTLIAFPTFVRPIGEYQYGLRFALLVVLWYALLLYFLPKLQTRLRAIRRRKKKSDRSIQSGDTV